MGALHGIHLGAHGVLEEISSSTRRRAVNITETCQGRIMDLLSITQAFFMLGFVAMAAGTLYFVLERGDLKPEHRIAATYAGAITFIAAIMYWIMTDFVGFFDQTSGDVAATMP